MTRWVVEVPGPRSGGRTTPWIRHKVLPPEASVEEVAGLILRLAASLGAARATSDGVEIVKNRRSFSITRWST